MNVRLGLALQIASVALPLLTAPGLSAQVQQPPLVRALIQGSMADREEAVATLGSMDPAAFPLLLRLAVITAFEREVGVFRHAKRYGTVMGPWDLRSFHTLTRVAAGLRDSTLVNSLAVTLGDSSVARALVGFGEAAVQPVVDEVAASLSGRGDGIEGLLILRALVERTDRPLSDEARASIQEAVEACLTTGSDVGILWRAIDLAIVLQDPHLRTIVQSLASDSAAVVALGITDPALIQNVQKRATDRLAGVPAPPAVR